jgi:hypothetical protein
MKLQRAKKIIQENCKTGSTAKCYLSCVNKLHEYGLLSQLADRETVEGKLKELYPIENTRKNYIKTIKTLCDHASHEDMMDLLNIDDWLRESVPQNTIKSEFDKRAARELWIIPNEVAEANKLKRKQNPDSDTAPPQVMDEKQKSKYIAFPKYLDVLKNELAEINSSNVLDKQFVIALAIMICSDKILRNDIGITRILGAGINHDDVDDVSTISEINPILIHIKKTKKTCIEAIDINFNKEIIPYVKMLIDAQVNKNKTTGIKNYLLMKPQSRDPVPTGPWFAKEFSRSMERYFGKKLGCTDIRLSYGIHLSRSDNGDASYQQKIERCMNHSYSMHQAKYNLYKNLPDDY